MFINSKSFRFSHLKRVLFGLVLCFYLSAFAHGDETNNSEFLTFNINHQVSLDVFVPQDSGDLNNQFATLYVMDGTHFFYNAIAYQKSLRFGVNVTPAFIVVGINLNSKDGQEPSRWETFGPNAHEMIALLEDEIIPLVEDRFPTNDTRMFFGWQFAAGFGLDLFARKPDMMDAYFLASSPTYTEKRLARASVTLDREKPFNHSFYITLGKIEAHSIENHTTLERMLSAKRDKGIDSLYHFSESHNHQTTPLDSFTNGLNWYFQGYADLTFHSVEDINQFGGIKAVKAYFKNRSVRYNLSHEIGEQALFSMFRHAAEENDWSFYQKLEHAFGAYTLSNDSSVYWYRMFADFFIANNAEDKAIATYQDALKHHTNSHQVWAALSSIYESQNKNAKALSSLTRAFELTEPETEHHHNYKNKLAQLGEAKSQ